VELRGPYGTFTKNDLVRTADSPGQAVQFRFDGWEQVEAGTAESPPPKTGRGSGRDAWADYAGQHDVTVDDTATREDIVAALDAADVATE
jgi:hypothetical protein